MKNSLIIFFILYSLQSAAQLKVQKILFLGNGQMDIIESYSNGTFQLQGVFKDSLVNKDTTFLAIKKYNQYTLAVDSAGGFQYPIINSMSYLDNMFLSKVNKYNESKVVVFGFKDSFVIDNVVYHTRGLIDFLIINFQRDNSINWVKQIGSEFNDLIGSINYDKSGNTYLGAIIGENKNGSFIQYPHLNKNVIDSLDITLHSKVGQPYIIKVDSYGSYSQHKAVNSPFVTTSDDKSFMFSSIDIGVPLTIDGISVHSKTTGFTDGASAVFKMDTNFVAQYGFSISPMNQSLTGSTGVGFTNRMFSGDALGNSYFAGTYDKCGVDVSSPTATDAILNPSKSWINNDIVLVKYDSLGKLAYATSHGNDGAFDYVNSILPDDKGNLYVCGGYVEKIKFGSDSLTCSTSNMFIAKLDPMGKPIWLKQCDGAAGAVNNLVILNDSSIAALCYLQQGSSFDGIFATKSGYHIVFFNEVNYPTKIPNVEVTSTNPYPNPANNYLIIQAPAENLLMYNLLGENMVVKTEQVDNFTKVQTGDLPDGIYFIKYQNNHTITTSKILIKH